MFHYFFSSCYLAFEWTYLGGSNLFGFSLKLLSIQDLFSLGSFQIAYSLKTLLFY